jgi:hypothetical protein
VYIFGPCNQGLGDCLSAVAHPIWIIPSHNANNCQMFEINKLAGYFSGIIVVVIIQYFGENPYGNYTMLLYGRSNAISRKHPLEMTIHLISLYETMNLFTEIQKNVKIKTSPFCRPPWSSFTQPGRPKTNRRLSHTMILKYENFEQHSASKLPLLIFGKKHNESYGTKSRFPLKSLSMWPLRQFISCFINDEYF